MVRESERELRRLYPRLWLDNRGYVTHQLIHDLGITPTSSDLYQMGGDCPPPSILADGQHLTPAAADRDGRHIAAALIERGLVP